MNIKRNIDLLTEENRKQSIQEIITFFNNERDEKIGMIAAENILDHVLQNIGKSVYNKGVEDALSFLKERFENLELDMETLLKK